MRPCHLIAIVWMAHLAGCEGGDKWYQVETSHDVLTNIEVPSDFHLHKIRTDSELALIFDDGADGGVGFAVMDKDDAGFGNITAEIKKVSDFVEIDGRNWLIAKPKQDHASTATYQTESWEIVVLVFLRHEGARALAEECVRRMTIVDDGGRPDQ